MQRVDDVEYHVYDVITRRRMNYRDLGFVNRKDGPIELSVGEYDLEITQSLSGLNSTALAGSGTTGYVAWKISPVVSEWILKPDSLGSKLFSSEKVVVEMGCGVAAILASVIGPRVHRFIATDQHHILKLARRNLETNKVHGSRFKGVVDIEEYDWEHLRTVENFKESIVGVGSAGLVVACDTIFNDHLIGPFIEALHQLTTVMGPGSAAVIAMQQRSENITRAFLEGVSKLYTINCVVEGDLGEAGYLVYYLQPRVV